VFDEQPSAPGGHPRAERFAERTVAGTAPIIGARKRFPTIYTENVRNQETKEAKPAWRIFFKIFIAGGGMRQDVAGRRGMPQFAPHD
jgi:hypothetical protein